MSLPMPNNSFNTVPRPASGVSFGSQTSGPPATTSGRHASNPTGTILAPSNPPDSFSERPKPNVTAISEGLRLYNNLEYSDLELRCEGRTYKVHRVIVCGRCEFFKACVDRHFKGQEAGEGVIELPDDDPDAIEVLIKYLYTYDIDTCLEGLPQDRKASDELAVSIFSAADKYMLPELKQHWYDVLEKSAKMLGWTTERSVFSFPKLKGKNVAEFLSLIYSCDTPGIGKIRELAIDALYTTGFFGGLTTMDEAMRAVFQSHGEFRMDLLNSLLQRAEWQKPLIELMKHESIHSAIADNADIGIELIQNLIEPRRPGGQQSRFVF